MSNNVGARSWSAMVIAVTLAGTCIATTGAQAKKLDFELSATVKRQFKAWAENPSIHANKISEAGIPIFENLIVHFSGDITNIGISRRDNYIKISDNEEEIKYHIYYKDPDLNKNLIVSNSPDDSKTRHLKRTPATFKLEPFKLQPYESKTSRPVPGNYSGELTLIFEELASRQ